MNKLKKTKLLKMTDKELDEVVKIQGTNFDRKRKVPVEAIEEIREACSKDHSLIPVYMEKYNVCYHTIWGIATSYTQPKHLGTHPHSPNALQDRAEYKRQLIEDDKIQ